jgi:U3 small nucleolar RNA-associated protein 22
MDKLSNQYVGIFKYFTPSNIMIGGSYSLNTMIGPDVTIDILVEMPEKLFRRTDWKNYVYIRKKAIYLAFIGNTLDKELVESVCFTGNHSNPILKIIPNGKLSKRCIIYVHLVIQDNAFPLKKLTPEKNNVKHKWFFPENNLNNGEYFFILYQ